MVKPWNKDELFQKKDGIETCQTCFRYTGAYCRLTEDCHEPTDYCPHYQPQM